MGASTLYKAQFLTLLGVPTLEDAQALKVTFNAEEYFAFSLHQQCTNSIYFKR